MQKTDKQKIKRQIEQETAKIIKTDDVGLVISLLNTCNALLKLSESAMSELDEMHVNNDIFAEYLSFAVKVNRFFESYSENDNEIEINKKLNSVIDDVHRKNKKTAELQSKLDMALSENEALTSGIDDLKARIEEQRAVNEGLVKMRDEYRPEMVDAQKRDNDELFLEITRLREELDEQKSKHSELEIEKKNFENNISEVENSINEIPEEIKNLRTKYHELKIVLSELQSAETEYSTEKQENLKKKIDELTPIVEENRVATEVLTNRLESLETQKTQYDSEKHMLSTNVIELISSSLSELKEYLTEYETELITIEETADALAFNLCKCNDRYKEYSNWCDSTETPLLAMNRILDKDEYSVLKETLDVGQIPSVKKRFEDIRQNLLSLDDLLSKCSDSLQRDLQRIRDRAEK